MVSYGNIFDVRDLLVNEVFGNKFLFLLGTCVLIFYLCTKFRVGDNATFLLLAFWLLLMSAVLDSVVFLGLILVIVGIYYGTRIVKVIQRQ